MEILTLHESDGSGCLYGALGYYVRGHVDPAVFFAAVLEQIGPGVHVLNPDTMTRDRLIPFALEDVEQTYWHNVPTGEPGGYLCYPSRAGVRGAYPVTYLERDAAVIRSNQAAIAAGQIR